MKIIKKICAISLVLSMLLSMSAMAVNDVNNEPDPYAIGLTETLYIDGVNTTFYHYYTSDGERAIDVSYENRLDIDTVINESSNTKYLNDKGNVSLVDKLLRGGGNTDWELIGGPESTYISWLAGTTTAVVAAAIGAKLGLSSGNVYAVVGAAILSVLAASFSGSTITYWLYERRINWVPTHKYEWSLKVNTGEVFGPFSFTTSPK